MTKEEYISTEIEKMVHFWAGLAAFFGGIFFVALSAMDYIATPGNFSSFLKYRLLGAFIFALIYLLNLRKVNLKYQMIMIYIAVISSVSIIEYMILHFGGHLSTYYGGLFILVVVVVGFIPITLKHSIYLTLIALSIYIIPILIWDQSLNYRYFIMPLSFLTSSFVIANIWRYLSQTRLQNELGLQYELAQDKEQLRQYSSQLEDLVSERTQELNKSVQWHRSLFENATDGILVLDKNNIIINANDKVCEMHGFSREALVGAHLKLLEADTQKDVMAERLHRVLAGESLVYETKHNKKDGTTIYMEVSSKEISIGNEQFIQSFYRDITERKKFQEHLFQSQKMESIGVLAGGIAHDFNNILTAILGHTEVVRKISRLDVKAANSLSVIEDAARRAGRMISKLLGFARKSKYELVPLNLNDVVYDTIKLLERVIDKRIEMSVELDSHIPIIQGDTNHIEQIVMNLIINARDAMPKGGKIVVNTSVLDVKPGMPDVPPYIVSGQYVVLMITDTGIGMTENVRSKIFEPFFTTKERGKGTGLGLSMVYGAVKEHKGYITVTSEVGIGSSFSVYLPAFSQAATTASVLEKTASLNGDETILLVDDEDEVLKTVESALENHGYKVVALNDSTNALSVFNKIHQEISLVITDIAMPNMDGKELIKKIKETKPEIKIVAMSGHTKYIADKDGIREIDGFLKKPFESPYLLSVVRRILDTKSRASLTI